MDEFQKGILVIIPIFTSIFGYFQDRSLGGNGILGILILGMFGIILSSSIYVVSKPTKHNTRLNKERELDKK